MRLRAAALAFALALPFAASAQKAEPDLRPSCIDWAAVGVLHPTGYRDASGPDDLIGHGWFDYQMRIRRPVWNAKGERTVPVSLFGHAMYIIYPPTLVFRSKGADGEWNFVGMSRVIYGRKGPVIPIFGPLDPANRDWRPDGYERFVHPVRIAFDRGSDVPYESDDAVPGYSEVKGGRLIVLKGIYLKDLPELLATIPVDGCVR